MEYPLVTVICLCYNQAKYVEATLDSVLTQDYPNLELLVVDDCSTDNSAAVIRKKVEGKQQIRFFQNEQNLGNCRSFNLAFLQSSGEFLIDLAADDLLEITRVRSGVETLTKAGPDYGVHFTNAWLIDAAGNKIRKFYADKDLTKVPRGKIYRELLARHFICSPTMMIRRNILEQLQGYDPGLAYEDFDFWVRSSRICKYTFTPQPLVSKRIHPGSFSTRQYLPGSRMLASTGIVCEKALKLNQDKADHLALISRLKYEIRQALVSDNREVAICMLNTWKKTGLNRNYYLYELMAKSEALIFLLKKFYWFYRRLSSSSSMLR